MAKTFDEVVYSLCKNYTDQSQLGFKSVKQVANGFEIEYVNGTKATYTVQNMHQHTNMTILSKFSLSADGKLLYDGKPIEGAGGAGEPYDDAEVRGLINTNKTNIATNTSDISDLNTKIGTTAMGTTATDVTGAVAEVNGNLLDLTTHTDDTDIHITTTERTKWNEVVNKANKTEVLLQDKIQTISGNETHVNVYSAKLTKTELDKKANDDEVVKKTDISTTINSTSTNDKAAGAKAVNDKLSQYVHIDAENMLLQCTASGTVFTDYVDENCISDFRAYHIVWNSLASGTPCFDGYGTIYTYSASLHKKVIAYDVSGNGVWELTQTGGVWGTWQQVRSSVADSSGTVTLPDGVTGTISYKVINGTCYVSVQKLADGLTGLEAFIFTGLPKADMNISISIENSGNRAGTIYSADGVAFHVHKIVADEGYGSFSYPVAE